MIIDVHSHCFPKKYLDYIAKKDAGLVEVARRTQAGNSEKELELRFSLMDRAGVNMQILSIVPQVPYSTNKKEAIKGAKMANDLYAQLVATYPKRFKAFGIFPLPHINESIEEIKRCYTELGMVGVTLTTTVLQKSLADSNFEPIFAELNRRKAVVFLHPAGCCTGEQTQVYGLNWMIGAPFEDTYAVLHLILSGLTSRYPDIQFISPHLGGYLPMIIQRIDNLYAHWGSGNIEGLPSTFIKKFWFDTVSHSHLPALQNACSVYNRKQILLGTDFPYVEDENYLKAVKYIEKADLLPQEIKNIHGLNAAHLLGLMPPSN